MLELTHTTSLSLWRSECAEKWICGRNRNTSSSHVQCSSRCPDAVFVMDALHHRYSNLRSDVSVWQMTVCAHGLSVWLLSPRLRLLFCPIR